MSKSVNDNLIKNIGITGKKVYFCKLKLLYMNAIFTRITLFLKLIFTIKTITFWSYRGLVCNAQIIKQKKGSN